MIDYEKLKLAHEIMLNNDKFYCTYEFGWCDKVVFNLYDDEDNYIIFTTYDVDSLIEKLQELTQPEAKYKMCQEVWINDHGSPSCLFISDVTFQHSYWEYNGLYNESQLYLTKDDLIEAQIKYWTELKQGGILPGKPGILAPFLFYPACQSTSIKKKDYTCTKCGQIIFGGYDCPCVMRDAQSNQPQVDAEECQHESDGCKYDTTPTWPPSTCPARVQYKCTKCGGFYR